MIESAYWVPGNQPIALETDAPSALVISGSAVVFAVDNATGVRRPLFSVEPGEPLLPLPKPLGAAWTVIAMPLESSGLQLGRDTQEWARVVALENWLAKIGEAFGAVRNEGNVRFLQPSQKVLLEKGRCAGIEEGLTFVRVETGRIHIGTDSSEGTTVAMVPGLVMEALEDSQVHPLEDPPLEAAEIIAETLDRVVPAFIVALDIAERRREQSDRARFLSRQQWNQRVSSAAVAELASVASRLRETSEVEPSFLERSAGGPLFHAVQTVAAVLNASVRPPVGLHRGEDEMREIAHASGLRSRVVRLRGEWWRRDNGPLVAFQHDGTPVALLPRTSKLFGGPRYDIVNPAEGTRVRVDLSTAAELKPGARMLYRPLPDDLSTESLLRYALSTRRWDLWSLGIAGFGAGLLALAAPQGSAILIGYAIPDADTNMAWQVALGMAAAAAGAALFLLVQSVALLRIQMTAFAVLQAGMWDYLLKLGPSFFRGFTAGQLRLRVDAVMRILQLLSADSFRIMFAAAASLLTLAFTFWYSAGLGLIGSASGVVVAGATWLGGRALLRNLKSYQESEESLSGLVLQAIQAVSKLRVAGAAGRVFSYWARAYTRKQKRTVAIQRIKDRVRLLNLVTPTAASACGFLFLLSHPLPLGDFLAANAALSTFLTAIVAASDASGAYVTAADLWTRMRGILEAKPEVEKSKTHPGRLRGVIAVEAVTFRYRSDGPLILDNVTIHAAPGECIALTGPSGSGKSTLLNLILRFETPHSGAIYLDGHELSSLDISAVRRQIGVVTQDARILAGSIFENICCGGIGTLDEAWEAARAAGLDRDVEAMPMRMHTVLSEGGGNLSGGQRQRILIARALVRRPSILIFDEATSALDNRTQAIVTESLRRLKATRILVAHRLSTIRNADRIYVIEKGRVVQQGRYRDLVGKPGLFARLASRQTV